MGTIAPVLMKGNLNSLVASWSQSSSKLSDTKRKLKSEIARDYRKGDSTTLIFILEVFGR